LAAAKGDCAACHAPHRAAAKGLLAKPAAALCGDCHGDLLARIRAGAAHAPAANGKCLTCHATHGSKERGMLVQPVAALCTSCHPAGKPELAVAHRDMDLAGADCVTCHDPHVGGKTKPALLHPVAHQPYASLECATCHTKKPATTVEPAGAALCLKCHEESRALLGRKNVHLPVVARGECLNCHRAHVGNDKALLIRAGADACFTCHEPAAFKRANRHKALDKGCGSCHDPHASNEGSLLVENQTDLCGRCHQDLSKHLHPVKGRDPASGRELRCSGCHDPHSSDQESLLRFEPRRELCEQCHASAMSAH
jgi:predicted CXXCH cytochrome family protein